MFLIFLVGQYYTGWIEYNNELKKSNLNSVSITSYFNLGHFIQATFENWESEFLQMAIYVLLTISLRQKGSVESKSLDGKDDVDREPQKHPAAPWAVKRGGIWLRIYSNSLSIVLSLLFILSFILHFYGSYKDHKVEQLEKGLNVEPPLEYFTNARFWFESFQNWQSEFLSVFAIVFLSIWLRQKGSPESKPVDALMMKPDKILRLHL